MQLRKISFAVFIACLNGVLLINISILYHFCNMRLYIVVDFGYCPVVIRGQCCLFPVNLLDLPDDSTFSKPWFYPLC